MGQQKWSGGKTTFSSPIMIIISHASDCGVIWVDMFEIPGEGETTVLIV